MLMFLVPDGETGGGTAVHFALVFRPTDMYNQSFREYLSVLFVGVETSCGPGADVSSIYP